MDDKYVPKVGRPSKVKDIDKELVFRLASLQCTHKEIAEAVGCSLDTLDKHFKNIIEQGKNVGRKSLRRAQFDKALNGDTRMLVWLGKQYLSQKDSPDTGEDSQPLPWDEN